MMVSSVSGTISSFPGVAETFDILGYLAIILLNRHTITGLHSFSRVWRFGVNFLFPWVGTCNVHPPPLPDDQP